MSPAQEALSIPSQEFSVHAMTAPAVAIPNALPPGLAKAGAASNAAGKSAGEAEAAGFGALVAAEGEAAAATLQAAAGEVAPAQLLVTPLAEPVVATGDVLEGEIAGSDTDAGSDLAALTDAALALDPVPAPTAQTIQTAAAEGASAPAFGRDKARGVPAAPALEHANPHARLAEKAGLVDETEQTPQAEEAPAEPTPRFKDPELPEQAQTVGRRALAAGVAPPRAAEAAQAAAKATDADAPEPAAPVAAVAEVDVAPAALAAGAPAAAALAARTEQPALRTAPAPKAERGKDSVDAPAPTAAARAAAPAKLAPAFAASGEAPAAAEEALTAETDALDGPDAGPAPAEQRAGAAQSAAAPIHTPVRGAPETVANLAAQILKKLEGQSTRFDVELDPAGLGRVDVRIEIGAHGRMTAAMMFDNPLAASELRARAGELQRALEQAGFDLAGGISFDVAGDRGNARQGHGQDDAPTGQGFRAQAFQAALDNAGAAADGAVSGLLRLRRGVTAGVDVRI